VAIVVGQEAGRLQRQLFGFLTNHDGHIPWQIPARKKLGRRLFGPNPAMYPVRERPWNRSTAASLSKHAQKTVAIHATRVFARREWW
jgi:hypothetical protein